MDWNGIPVPNVNPIAGIELGDLIRQGLEELEEKFSKLTYEEKLEVIRTVPSGSGWDIGDFVSVGIPGAHIQGDDFFSNLPDGLQYLFGSITIDGDPYWAPEANYLLWGFAWRMFHNHLLAAGQGKTISNYDPLYGPGPGPGHGTLHTYYITQEGKIGREVITLEDTLFKVKVWRTFKYGILGGRLLYDESLPERRSPGLGINPRLAFTQAGWDYYGEGPSNRGDLSAMRPARILDRTVIPNPSSIPQKQIAVGFGLGDKPGTAYAVGVTVKLENNND